VNIESGENIVISRKFLSCAGLWERSERASNLKVGGSSPSGRAIYFNGLCIVCPSIKLLCDHLVTAFLIVFLLTVFYIV